MELADSEPAGPPTGGIPMPGGIFIPGGMVNGGGVGGVEEEAEAEPFELELVVVVDAFVSTSLKALFFRVPLLGLLDPADVEAEAGDDDDAGDAVVSIGG